MRIFLVVSIFLMVSVCEAKKSPKTPPAIPPLAVSSDTAPAPVTGLPYEIKVDTRTNVDKLTDENTMVRRNAVILLGVEKKQKNIKHLARMLQDESPVVRRAAISGLLESSVSKEAMQSAGQAILDHFDSEKDLGVQIDSINAFGKLSYKKAELKLKSLLKNPYPQIRTYAVKALGEVASPENYRLFADLLAGEAESVRIQAAAVAAKLKIKSAVPNLLANLKHPISKVREAAVEALGELGDSKILPQLEELQKDEDGRVAEKAKLAVEKIRKRAGPVKAQ